MSEIVYKSLPDVSSLKLSRTMKASLEALVGEWRTLHAEIERKQERVDRIKDILQSAQESAKVEGFQADGVAFVYRMMEGRRMLDKALLIENGVDPRVVADSVKQGAPYAQRTIKVMDG